MKKLLTPFSSLQAKRGNPVYSVIPGLTRNLYLSHPERQRRISRGCWLLLEQVKRFLVPLGMTLVVCLILTTFYLILPTPALAVAVTWDGGASGSWNTATSWSNDTVPTSSDDVTIDNAAVTTSSNISFSTLTIGSGTNTTSLTLTNNITSGGSITINNAGTLTQNNKVQQTIFRHSVLTGIVKAAIKFHELSN